MNETINHQESLQQNTLDKFDQLVDLDRAYDTRIAELFQSPRKLNATELQEIETMARELYALEVGFMHDVDLPKLNENKPVDYVPPSEEIVELGRKWEALNASYDKEFQSMLQAKMTGPIDLEAAIRLRSVQQELLDLEKMLFAYCETL